METDTGDAGYYMFPSIDKNYVFIAMVSRTFLYIYNSVAMYMYIEFSKTYITV